MLMVQIKSRNVLQNLAKESVQRKPNDVVLILERGALTGVRKPTVLSTNANK
jgi:hypothetical protein